MLQVRNLKVSYDGVLAVSNVNLKVGKGKLVALVGGNGNGKSTTLRAIAGLNAAEEGQILFNDVEIQNVPAHKRVPMGLSLVPEGRRLFARLTVQRNLELGAYTRDDAREVGETLDRVYSLFPILKERRFQQAGTMSGGEQQMLAIGRGMMSRPSMLLLDEPSWGIAPKFVTRVLDTIVQVNQQGVSVLLVEQSLHKALAIADYGYVIQTGRIALEGSGSELLNNEDVKKAYLGL
ncbi:MAG: Branched-chain amino acid transport ATP-binding protein livF [Herminiimonas sp.]|nr:Branched-chain amino acid transport ATP-binding protein livF [Herminiimonas sp.]